MASVTLKHIFKHFPGGVTAVDDFCLEIEDREFIILVGPSGCGKSTTLRMIAGLEEISEGEMFIEDQMVNNVPPKDRDIAMVFQNYALYPHMTVYDNMAFGLKLRKMSKDEIRRRVQEAAEILDIAHLLSRRPRALSGGQRQRVALGRAIVREPKVFLLDEPLSNLDAKLRTQMRTEIAKLHKRLGTTFIYVTHDQVEAMTMADRIVVMKDGLIQQVDSPQNLYHKPCNMFVAGFMGSPQMNFLDVVLEKRGGKMCAVIGKDGRQCVLELPAQKAEAAESYAGKEMVMGIRPEHISDDLSGITDRESGVLNTTVEVSEMMGAETCLYLSCPGTSLVARVSPGSAVRAGDMLPVALDARYIHLFDRETEETVCN